MVKKLRHRLAIAIATSMLLLGAGLTSPGLVGAGVLNPACQDNGAHYHTGKSSWAGNMRGIRADFTPSDWSLFGPCAWGVWGNDGVYSYISIGPAPNNDEWGNGNAILQLGVILCNDAGNATCKAQVSPAEDAPNYGRRFAWAYGGCSPVTLPIPILITQDINGNHIDPGIGKHTYAIRRDQDDEHRAAIHYDLKIDGDTVAIVDPDQSGVSCWIKDSHGDKQVDFQMEALDRGDHFGNANARSEFRDMDVRTSTNSNWVNWGPTNCVTVVVTGEHENTCGYFDWGGGETSIYIWTYHQ